MMSETITFTTDEATARAMFVHDSLTVDELLDPTVKFLVVDDPLVCTTVDIVTCGIEMTEYEAGTLTIGPAMQILDDVDLVGGICTDPHHLIAAWERIGGTYRDLVIECIGGVTDDITDQFGSQDVTTERWAHPILEATP